MPSSAINEPALYITEVKATDRAYAQRLRGKLDDLRAFNTQLSSIRESFTEATGFAFERIAPLSEAVTAKAQTKFERGLEWVYVRNILQQPHHQIQQQQFAHAAQFFVNQTTLAGQERFLNLLLEPVDLRGVSNPYRVTAFTVCSNKLGNVQWHIQDKIGDNLVNQLLLSGNDPALNDLVEQGDHLKRLSSFLTVTSQLTGPGPFDQFNHPFGVQQNVLLGIGGINPITLAEGLNSINMTFNRGQIYSQVNEANRNEVISTLQPTFPSQRLHEHYAPNDSSQIRSSTINISYVAGGNLISADYVGELISRLYMSHQFNPDAHLSKIAGETLKILATFNLKGATYRAIDIALNYFNMFQGMSSAEARAIAIQSDFLAVGSASSLADFHADFALRSVVISEIGQPPQLLGWPTTNTIGSFAALSATFTNNQGNLGPLILNDGNTNRAITNDQRYEIANQGGFGLEELLGNADRALELHSILNTAGRGYFESHRDPIWDAIRNRTEAIPISSTPSNTSNSTIDINSNTITPER